MAKITTLSIFGGGADGSGASAKSGRAKGGVSRRTALGAILTGAATFAQERKTRTYDLGAQEGVPDRVGTLPTSQAAPAQQKAPASGDKTPVHFLREFSAGGYPSDDGLNWEIVLDRKNKSGMDASFVQTDEYRCELRNSQGVAVGHTVVHLANLAFTVYDADGKAIGRGHRRRDKKDFVIENMSGDVLLRSEAINLKNEAPEMRLLAPQPSKESGVPPQSEKDRLGAIINLGFVPAKARPNPNPNPSAQGGGQGGGGPPPSDDPEFDRLRQMAPPGPPGPFGGWFPGGIGWPGGGGKPKARPREMDMRVTVSENRFAADTKVMTGGLTNEQMSTLIATASMMVGPLEISKGVQENANKKPPRQWHLWWVGFAQTWINTRYGSIWLGSPFPVPVPGGRKDPE